jgi:hypothetical protein
MTDFSKISPGLVVLLGSGETLPSSGKIHEFVARRLPENPRLVILETPAGFEPNSDLVAGKIKDFLARRLQNYQPKIQVLPARRRGTEFSPDNPDVVAPILEADEILLGPGSPTYGVRQLKDSLALQMIAARQRLGGTLFLSSSAPISFGTFTLPVYEIYKAGQDLHWMDGLNFFRAYGLSLSFITHWNNRDGGDELDTSCCYIGQARFKQLQARLPEEHTLVGIDEHTALILDFEQQCLQVSGMNTITVLQSGESLVLESGQRLPLETLGAWHFPGDHSDIPSVVWDAALRVNAQKNAECPKLPQPPSDILQLAQEREQAREEQNWSKADEIREQLLILGWQISDTADGSQLAPLEMD